MWTVPGSGVGAGVAGPLCPVTVRPSVSGATFTAFFRWLQSSSRGRLGAPGPARGIPKGGVSLSVSIQMWVTQTRSSCKGRLCIAHACMHTHIHTHMCTHMHAHPITPHPTGGPAGLGVARLPPGEGDAASSKVKARLMEGSWGSEPLLSPRGQLAWRSLGAHSVPQTVSSDLCPASQCQHPAPTRPRSGPKGLQARASLCVALVTTDGHPHPAPGSSLLP